MKHINGVIRSLLAGSCILLMALSTVAHAQDDLDVTMRMVTDDEDLGGAFVQELQLPEPVESEMADFDAVSPGRDIAQHAREAGRKMGETLAEQARESRDAMNDELPGEMLDTMPLPKPGGDERPGLDLPGLEDPDLPLVDEDKLLNTTGDLIDKTGELLK
ncbi:MAG: hypothetical protein R3175_04195 [Marinobacter sp.]|uniref:hypothetical protein n=1 Tax=Marinobacter sp. TaxID=50741 RepID=UPI00299DA3AD|nr:hypothetical protein [Marinobacter sp.]MDX1755241.1 hypothetical protein [Marinobacter sp.]